MRVNCRLRAKAHDPETDKLQFYCLILTNPSIPSSKKAQVAAKLLETSS